MIQFANHALRGFDASLQSLCDHLHHMVTLVEQQVTLLAEAVGAQDAGLHTQSKTLDKEINDAELQIDRDVTSIISKYAPASEELRFLLGVVKVSGSLEMIADHMKNGSKRLAQVQHPLDAEIEGALTQATQALRGMVTLGFRQVMDYSEEASDEMLTLGAQVQRSYRGILLRLSQLALEATQHHAVLLVAKNLDQASDKAVDIMKVAHFAHYARKYQRRQS